MEMNKQLSVAEITAQLEAHEAFLKTPEGQEWKAMNEQIVDYLDLFSPDSETSEQAKRLFESMRTAFKDKKVQVFIPTGFRSLQDLIPPGGFKRGELFPIFANTSAFCEHKSDFVLNMALRRMAEDPTYRPVFRVSFEHDLEYFDEDRFKQSLKNLGIDYINPSDDKEAKQ